MLQGKARKWMDYMAALPLNACVSVLGYSSIYRRNTQKPIQRIIDSPDEKSLIDEIDRWARWKLKEAQYVQVAGAIMFASTISCLSWSNLSASYWSSAALWYGSIVLALTAVMLGAQQVMFLPDHLDGKAARDFRRRLMAHSSEKLSEPRQMMLFAWQAPLMCLSCSTVFFLAGLTSVVVSPLAQNPAWNAEAKTVVLYLVVWAFSLATFFVTSLAIHALLEDHLGDAK